MVETRTRALALNGDVATPLPDAAGFLTDGASFDDLARMAAARTGLQAANDLRRARGTPGERCGASPVM